MPLPAYTKTWQYSRNNTTAAQGSALATNRRTMRSLVNLLLGFATSPWTERYSCDGTTAGTAGDGVNRWSVDANLVWGTGAHSWQVIRQTGLATNAELCIDLNSAGSGTITLVYSQSAGFTGGTTTARPTATDEIVLLSGASWGVSTSDVQTRYSAMQSTDGQCTRIIMCMAGVVSAVYVIDKPTNTTTGWTNPNFCLAYASSTSVSPTIANLDTLGRSKILGTTATMQMLCEGTASGAAIANSTWGNLPNDIDGSWPMFPVGIASTTALTKGRHATLQDLYWGSQAIAVGEGYPADGTNRWIQVGGLLLPWGDDSTGLNLT